MKDHLLSNGTLLPWNFGAEPLPPNSDGRLVERVEDPLPELGANQVAEPGEVDYDPESDVSRQRWVVREMTEDEQRFVIPPSVFLWERLTSEERQAIRTIAQTEAGIADLWDRLLTLKEGIISDDPLTAVARGACSQVFGESRAKELFAKP